MTASGLLDAPEEEVFDRAVRLAMKLTGRQAGLLSLVDEHRRFFLAQSGLPKFVAELRETPLSHSFCKHVVEDGDTLRIDDARTDPRVSGNLAIDELDVIAYLGVPVHAPDGQALGSLCVIDGQPHKWSDEDLAVLKDISAMVEAELDLRQTVEQRNMLIQEMNHRIKNLFTLLGGMVRQVARDAEDAASMSEDILGRLHALGAAHELIMPGALTADGKDQTVHLDKLVAPIISPYPRSQFIIDGPEVTIAPRAAVALALSLHELTTNAAKYGALAHDGSEISLSWAIDGEYLVINWREELSADLDDDADKGSAGFGSRLLKMNIECQLGGQLSRQFTPRGLHVGIRVPLAKLNG
ncbi:MAG: GAF domain-containing protein [Pseudomonadota bacterium]